MMPDSPRALGAIQTPAAVLAAAQPIELALAEAPIPAPAKFHSPKCQPITLDQGAFGACVAYSGAYIQADQELADEGRQLLPGILDPLHAYALVKGLPWPLTDPSQDPNPGLNPPQLWDYTKAHGWPTKDGTPPRKDASSLLLGKPMGNAAFLAVLQQTILQLGPCQFTAGWPNNWWDTDAAGVMPTPAVALAGGHAFEGCGWEVHPDGSFDTIHHQSWGPWGHDPEFPNHFRVHARWWDRLGWEAWKVVDVIGDKPAGVVYTAHVPAGPINVYALAGGLITGRRSLDTLGTTSVCTKPRSYKTAAGWTIDGRTVRKPSSATLVQMASGTLTGLWIPAAAANVTHT